MAPGAEVGENTTHGLALSRLKHGFESRWGNQLIFVDVLPGSLDDGNPSARHLCSIGSRHSVLSRFWVSRVSQGRRVCDGEQP